MRAFLFLKQDVLSTPLRLKAAITYQCGVAGSSRQFSSSSVALARKTERPVLTKAQRAAKERKKAAKAPKSIRDKERMPLASAIEVLRAVEVGRPFSTYELTVKTQMPRGSAVPKGRINLPREVKPKMQDRVFVFAEGRQAEEAKRAGAEFVGGLDTVDAVASGRYPATLFLCTPALIRGITPKLGRILGPRGLMPSERRGTVTDDIAGYLKRIQGSSEWRGDKAGTIRTAIAKIDFPVDDVLRNVRFFLSAVKKATGNQMDETSRGPSKSVKPVNAITRVILSSTQGPGIRISDF